MSEFAALLIVVSFFILRLAAPLMLTLGIGRLMQWYAARWGNIPPAIPPTPF